MDEYVAALDRAHRHTLDWLASLPDRPVPPRTGIDEVVEALGPALPESGTAAADVVDLLTAACEPGLTAMPSGRFFGMVIGGAAPGRAGRGLAGQRLGPERRAAPGSRPRTAPSRTSPAPGSWTCSACPGGSAVGFVDRGDDGELHLPRRRPRRRAAPRRLGRRGARPGRGPRVRVLVGAERHDTVDLALRYLGLGAPETVPVDAQGRILVPALADALARGAGEDPALPTIVVLQAGNVHSGAFDPLARRSTLAHRHGAWVHVDGAFGLWAAAAPRRAHLVAGVDRADSWATDAHKTLNVPYDCGLAIVRDPAAVRAADGHAGRRT